MRRSGVRHRNHGVERTSFVHSGYLGVREEHRNPDLAGCSSEEGTEGWGCRSSGEGEIGNLGADLEVVRNLLLRKSNGSTTK